MIIIPINSWSEFKALALDKKKLSIQYTTGSDRYEIYCAETPFVWNYSLMFSDTADKTDFETNHQPSANKRLSIQVTPFAANKVAFDGRAANKIITAGQTDYVDYLVSDQMLINGGMVYFHNGVAGDTFTCQVIDKDGIYAPPGTVLNQWITDWNVFPNTKQDLTTPQAGTIYPGLYLRLNYTSTGGTDVHVLINYKLNKEI